MTVHYEWRAPFDNAAVDALHAEGFGHAVRATDWQQQVERHSLGWVCAFEASRLIGFVNVAWDGGRHAFILDTVVAAGEGRNGLGSSLVRRAREGAAAAGCEWLHVDFEEHLRPFYYEACGFTPADAGLVRLDGPAPGAP